MRYWLKLCSFIMCMGIIPLLSAANSVAENYIDIKELKREAAIPWKANYTDEYGRDISVDIFPMIPDIQEVPILFAEKPIINEDNVSAVSGNSDLVINENEFLMEYSWMDAKNNKYYKVGIGRPEINSNYIIINCSDQEADVREGGDIVENITAYYLPYEIDFNHAYLNHNNLTVKQCVELATQELSPFFNDYNLAFQVFRVGVDTAKGQYKCVLRQSINGIPILLGACDPARKFYTSEMDKVLSAQWIGENMLKYGDFFAPAWTFEVQSTNNYSIYFRPLKVTDSIERDVPLCRMDKIIESIENRITTGYIRNIYSLNFGYCCFLNDADQIVLFPVWEIECDYVVNPAEEITIYPENAGAPVTSSRYYSTMTINAQTGEFIDPMKLKKDILTCPSVITWKNAL